MKRIALALAAFAGIGAGAGLAQTSPENTGIAVEVAPLPVATPVAGVARPSGTTLTQAQRKMIAQAGAVRPGYYRLRSLHAGLCGSTIGIDDNPPFQLGRCDAHRGFNNFAVLPHPGTGYTLRSHPTRYGYSQERDNTSSELGNCLTTARNVLIGAPRIELRPCDVTGTDWSRAGAGDQRFFIQKIGSDTYQIALSELGDSTDCWVLRDGGRNEGTEVIRWQCARTPDQLWQLEWAGPLEPALEARLLDQTGWYRTPSGHFSILGADSLDIQGNVYSRFETANDNGDYCRKRCAELDRCKAWTWTGQGLVGNDPPMCMWMDSVGPTINRGSGTAGKLRSGIVRQ